MAFVAHELRNPLSAIRMGSDHLQRAGMAAKALDVVARNAGLMERIVADLLIISKLEAGPSPSIAGRSMPASRFPIRAIS